MISNKQKDLKHANGKRTKTLKKVKIIRKKQEHLNISKKGSNVMYILKNLNMLHYLLNEKIQWNDEKNAKLGAKDEMK